MVSVRAIAMAAGIAVVLFVLLSLPALLRTLLGPIGGLVIPGIVALIVGYIAYEILSGWQAGG